MLAVAPLDLASVLLARHVVVRPEDLAERARAQLLAQCEQPVADGIELRRARRRAAFRTRALLLRIAGAVA